MEAYSGVHEDEVHLHEREDHLQHRVHAPEDHVARRRERYFEEGAELQSVVDHRAQTESYTNTNGLNQLGQRHVAYKINSITVQNSLSLSDDSIRLLPFGLYAKCVILCYILMLIYIYNISSFFWQLF